ncbi:hypothetical protein Mlute_02505 [Meiothermus luteus]|uniref:Metal-dependent enzyme n=1 Tax=Meiothermus luteus TaxID=2026184 RepID=A0A399EF31_9DEIN|nr:DUF1385 domain-containing protein [Meiothermus luteus]RIH82396.1 hypothetical protein Mlute_02505 [Meiothermus luteus]RMH58316.1 MAG: DUF1385 domain-containing protein [Deinococcota bacterium]
MMKAPRAWALAVRLPDGRIHVERHEELALTLRYPWARLPLVRGAVALWDALSTSYRSLSRSAELAGEEEEKVSGVAFYGTLAASLLVAFALFVWLPARLAGLLVDEEHFRLLFYAVAGLFEAGVLVGYLAFIGRMPEMRRFFMYHGAEHKAIAAYEKGLPLTVENVRAQPAYHPRCGTSFIAFTAVVGVFIYSFFPPLTVAWYWVFPRLLLIPVVAAVAYEVLRYSASHQDPLSRLFRWLGFKFQMLTVREPTDEMIEVAIASTQAAVAERPSEATPVA